MKKLIFFFLLFSLSVSSLISKPIIRDSIEIKYDTSLQKVVRIYEQVKSLSKALEKLQPIAIAENDNFYIFDIDENNNYKLVKKSPVSFPIPKGIRAAMPLEAYGFKCVCVVTGDAFDKLEDLLILFHEFVHCYQFGTVEMKLKENLAIYKKAMETQDYMWELNYAFPYAEDEFVMLYAGFIEALENRDTVKIKELRKKLKSSLYSNEYEYMTWQEWKEGYARYVENKLKKYFGLNINENGKSRPFSRITFYYGGSNYIEFLIKANPLLENDLELLYSNIYN